MLAHPRSGEWIVTKGVVISGAFFFFFPCNHIINIKKKILFPAKQKTA